MKVLLIKPKNAVWTGAITLPLSLAYLSAALEKDDHEVRCIDMNVDSNINIRNEIKNFDLIGVTSCTPSIKNAWEISKIAKSEGKTVVFGGPHPTAMPEESLNMNVDIVVRGEGEETIREICKNKTLENIKGISFKKDKKIIHNPSRPLIKDLDEIPFPARHLFDIRKYHSPLHKNKIINGILTSRGCPYNCNFCFKYIFGREYRIRSPRNIVEEWKQMLEMGIEEIAIIDDNFSINQERAIKICNMIVDEGLKIDWNATGGLRVDNVSKELFTAMKKSGCYRVAFGAESGSQYILDKIGKGSTLEQIRKAVKLAKEVGLEVTLFFMIGNLYETKETVEKTIEFAKELEPDFVQFNVAVPYPGTKMHEIIKKEGKFLITNWEEYGSYEGKAYFEHNGITKGFVEKMYKRAYRKYYLRPRIILKHLRKGNFGILRGLKFLK